MGKYFLLGILLSFADMLCPGELKCNLNIFYYSSFAFDGAFMKKKTNEGQTLSCNKPETIASVSSIDVCNI